MDDAKWTIEIIVGIIIAAIGGGYIFYYRKIKNNKQIIKNNSISIFTNMKMI
jgi:uncharacterized protein YpmB